MKTIFVGTSEFAVPCLEAVIASHHEILAVVTQPDRPHGRGMGLQMSPVKEIASAHLFPILQPERISSPESIAQIKSLGPIGAMIVVAYGQKIPTELLEWPAHGVVNVHGSILPKYRGAAPIQHALISGERQTGVTTMLMDEGWDTGDILLQDVIDITPDENAAELARRLSFAGARLLVRTLEGLEDGSVAPVPQDDELATIARSLEREDGAIDWALPAAAIVNRIRGCTPRPGAFTRLNDQMIKIWKASVDRPDGLQGEPGQIIRVDDHGIAVAASEGSVLLTDLQPESRKRTPAADFARGAHLKPGDRFEVRFELGVV